jgi:hypothetical protein
MYDPAASKGYPQGYVHDLSLVNVEGMVAKLSPTV